MRSSPTRPMVPADPVRVARACRIAGITMRFTAAALTAIAILALVRSVSLPAHSSFLWLWTIAFAFAPAMVSVILAEAVKRKKFWGVVASLSMICGVYFLALVAGTFIATAIISENLPSSAWFYVVLIGVSSIPYGSAIFSLMRTHDAMRPDDWNQE